MSEGVGGSSRPLEDIKNGLGTVANPNIQEHVQEDSVC